MSTTSQVTVVTDTDLAWAAGIIDGEGSISLARCKRQGKDETYSLRVQVGNTDPRMILRLKELFGGSIPKVENRGRYKPMWRWILYGNAAAVFLTSVLPYLVSKRDQAECGLTSRSLLRPRWNKKPEPEKLAGLRLIHDRMRALKQGTA